MSPLGEYGLCAAAVLSRGCEHPACGQSVDNAYSFTLCSFPEDLRHAD
jgi:hypothetical protein